MFILRITANWWMIFTRAEWLIETLTLLKLQLITGNELTTFELISESSTRRLARQRFQPQVLLLAQVPKCLEGSRRIPRLEAAGIDSVASCKLFATQESSLKVCFQFYHAMKSWVAIGD